MNDIGAVRLIVLFQAKLYFSHNKSFETADAQYKLSGNEETRGSEFKFTLCVADQSWY